MQLIFFLLGYVTKILGRYRKKYSNPEGKKYHIPHFYPIDTPTKILFRTSHKCLFPLQKNIVRDFTKLLFRYSHQIPIRSQIKYQHCYIYYLPSIYQPPDTFVFNDQNIILLISLLHFFLIFILPYYLEHILLVSPILVSHIVCHLRYTIHPTIPSQSRHYCAVSSPLTLHNICRSIWCFVVGVTVIGPAYLLFRWYHHCNPPFPYFLLITFMHFSPKHQ